MSAVPEHRFAVVLCADVVGYSRLMGLDEDGTLNALKMLQRRVLEPTIAQHGGRIVRTMGDGVLAEFNSVVQAVRCDIAAQSEMAAVDQNLPEDRRVRFRMAVNVGDVVAEGAGLYGEGIAVASKLESLADPGGITVGRAVRDQVRDRLPISFEDIGEHEVPDIARPVRVFRVVLEQSAVEPPSIPAPPAPVTPVAPQHSALAVLPFQNLGADAETEFFLDSLVEDLITELARARWFSVVARNSSFAYKAKSIDSKEAARQLGVRYLVEGSLRKSGDRVRISCHLADAASGQHLWAERFDGTLEESFDLQDRITESAVGSVDPALRDAEIARARKSEATRDPYDLFLQALPQAFAETPDGNAQALRLLARALQSSPSYPPANALAAWCYQERHLNGWESAGEDRQRAKELARTAIANGSDDPQTLALAGAVRAALGRDREPPMAAIDRATTLNPNSAFVLAFGSLGQCCCGNYDKAWSHAEKALRISPFDPLVSYAAIALAWSALLLGRDEDAVTYARRAIDANRSIGLSYCALAIASARLGRRDEARVGLQQLARIAPQFRIGNLRRIRFADAARLKSAMEELRAAGLPD